MIWALLLGAVPLDRVGAPLRLYLTQGDVVEHFRSVEPKLTECGSDVDRTLPLKVSLSPEGVVEVTWVGGDSSPFVDCARRVLESMKSPAHRGSVVHVSTTLYVRNGDTFVSPSLSIDGRYLGPLMLFISGGQTERETVMRHLNGTSDRER